MQFYDSPLDQEGSANIQRENRTTMQCVQGFFNERNGIISGCLVESTVINAETNGTIWFRNNDDVGGEKTVRRLDESLL